MDKEQYFKRYNVKGEEAEDGSFFRFVDRIRLLNTLILSCLDISELEKEKFLVCHYPVHEKEKLDYLRTEWCHVKNSFKKQDLNAVRNYFGERISLYFAWVQSYIIWLFFPGIIGLILFIIMAATGDY